MEDSIGLPDGTDKPLVNNVHSDDVRIITCQGCESECDVAVAIRNGIPTCLGGNNCPTGESFALSNCTSVG